MLHFYGFGLASIVASGMLIFWLVAEIRYGRKPRGRIVFHIDHSRR